VANRENSGSIAGFVRVKEIKTFSNDLSRDPDITCEHYTWLRDNGSRLT
jgi:hypothetical protein